VIVLAVRWYLRFGLSFRDVEELLAERGIQVDHVTIFRWVQRFTPPPVYECWRVQDGARRDRQMRCSAHTIPRAISTSPTLKTLLSGQEAGREKTSPRNPSRGSARAVEFWNPARPPQGQPRPGPTARPA
jgi:hypothetical protein